MDTRRNWSDIPDPYDILQVSPNAEQEVIEAAYRRLARKYHPDVNSNKDAPRRMKKLNEAYQILSNPYERSLYDTHRVSSGKIPRAETYTTSNNHRGPWWRWLLIAPTFVFGVILPGMMVRIIFEVWSLKLAQIIQGVTDGFCEVYFVTVIAPWAKFKVAVSVLFATLGLSSAAYILGLTYLDLNYQARSEISTGIITYQVGGIIAVWLIRKRKV